MYEKTFLKCESETMTVYVEPKPVMSGALHPFHHKFLWNGAPRIGALLPFLKTSQNISTSDMWWTNWRCERFFVDYCGTAMPVFARKAPYI